MRLSLTDPIVTLLTMTIVGQICLSVPILLTRSRKTASYLPLALFLLACGVLASNSIVSTFFPSWYVLYTAIAFPTLFILCPSLWFYVEGITASTPWNLQIKQARHYILLAPALIISIMILSLPTDTHTALFIEDVDTTDPFAITLMVSILVMVLLWLVQCGYTILQITHCLNNYRKQLKNLFSNNNNKELQWINWLLFGAAITWLSSLTTVFSSNLFENFLFSLRAEAFLSLLLIWSLAHYGLQQKPELPIYEKHSLLDVAHQKQTERTNVEMNVETKAFSTTKKYQRSALSKEQSNRIADKINTVMKNEQLFLDSNLSLQKLSQHTAISPNYISQTLNETLSVNFFDFVNQWRIEAAKPKIIANQNNILNIALEVGFNARSSFYKAFKQTTGQTPSQYRKQYVQGKAV